MLDSIRPIKTEDAVAAARLSEELGYPVTPQAMRRRIELATGARNRIVLVACIANDVVGWIDVGIVNHLQTEPHGEICGLIVSQNYRSLGIGKCLLEEAERWVADQGLDRIVVRSQMKREAAHRFYLREAYEWLKVSSVFAKNLRAARPGLD